MMQESDRQFKEMSKATDRKLQELAESQKETDRQLKNLGQQIGGLHNSLGSTLELLMTPNLTAKFQKMGYDFTSYARNREIKEDGQAVAEIDVFVENGEYALAVEVKTKPNDSHIREHLQRMEVIRRYADQHGDKRKLLGAIAAPGFTDLMRKKVLAAGLFVIEAAEESVEVAVPKGFKPRKW
jgi:hypothetical protein